MTVIFCLDDKNGYMFNKRRQSRDRVLCEDVLKLAEGHTLYISPYSANLFPENGTRVVPEPLSDASEEDFCFIEDRDPNEAVKAASRVIVYHWNRSYPGDRFFDTALLNAFCKESSETLVGSSHPEILKEVFCK